MFIRPGDIVLAEAEDRYRMVEERVQGRLRTLDRDRKRREKQYAEARAGMSKRQRPAETQAVLASVNARLAGRRR